MEYKRLGEINLIEHIGDRVFVSFVARDVDVREQKNGGEFMSFNMCDRDISVETKIFSLTHLQKQEVIGGLVYNAAIDVKPYAKGKDGISCIVYNIERSAKDPKDYLDWIKNIEYCKGEINKYLTEYYNTDCGKICSYIIGKYMEQFLTYPAAKSMHHTELGGLLWHTVSVTKNAIRLAETFKEMYSEDKINMSLLVNACILHDIGKAFEFSVDFGCGQVEYSKYSQYMSHIIISTMIVRDAARDLNINGEIIEQLCHCILAHHGKLEYGSPIMPNMIEAKILSEADAIDAFMWRFNKNCDKECSKGYYSEWLGGSVQSYIESIK